MSSSRHFPGGRRQGKEPEKSSFAQTCNLLSQYVKEKGSLRDLNIEIGGKVKSVEAIASTSAISHSNNAKSAQPSPQKHPPMDPSSSSARSDTSAFIVEVASNKASTSKEATKAEPKKAQLTIFYSGRVLVFDNYPMEKVRDLVSLAKKSSSQMSYGILSNAYQEKVGPTIAVNSATTQREGLPPRPHVLNNKQPFDIFSNNFRDQTSYKVDEAASSSLASEELSPESEVNGSDLPIARRSSIHRFLEKRKDRAAIRGPYQNQEHPGPSTKGDEPLDLNILP